MPKRASVFVVAALAAHTASAADKPADPSSLEEIIVTASPLTTNPDQSTGIAGKVNRDRILREGGASLADALRNTPGVTGTGFAAGANRPVIRGFDANRVRLLEDGVGSFDVSDVGPDHGVPIDPLTTETIEVVRGPATLRYGSQAIGGVVNAIDNRVPRSLPQEAVTGEFSGSYGSVADATQGAALMNAALGQFAVHADAFTRHTGDYDIPGGTQPNSFFSGGGYSLGSSRFFGDGGRVGLAGVHYDAKYGIPSDITYIDMRQNKGIFSASLPFKSPSLQMVNIDAGYGDYTHSEIDPSTGIAGATFNDIGWDLRSEALFAGAGPFSSSALGLQLMHRDFSALGEGADYLLPTRTRSEAVFGFAKAPLSDRLSLELGARAERVTTRGVPLSDVPVQRDVTPLSAAVGFLYDASEAVRVGLTVSSTARSPAQTELFARGPHDGPATYEIGDPDLGMERANSIEGTIRLRLSDAVRFDGALWTSRFNHFIYGRLTGRTCDESGNCVVGDALDLKELLYEQTGARFRGAEGKAQFALAQLGNGALSAEVFGDYVRATLSTGGNVPRIPPWHLGAGISWESDAFDAGVLASYSARQDKVATAETPTDSFTSLDAHLGWRPLASAPGFELQLIGHNLTNSIQRDAVALNKDQVVMPGRDIRLMLHVSF